MIIWQYIIVGIIMIIFGQIVGHLNKKMPPVVSEEITYKEFFKSLKSDYKVDIKYSLIMTIISIIIIKYLGVNFNICIILLSLPMLMIVFSIDYRFQLIPDEAHVYFAALGIVNLIININSWTSYLLGALVGGGIFLAIAGFAILVLKKEGMGFGDVKLMASIGFLIGVKNILAVTLCSFFIGAIIGGILLIIKKKDGESYIAFGPFIVIATLIIMFFGADTIFDMYFSLCMFLSDFVTDIIYKIVN